VAIGSDGDIRNLFLSRRNAIVIRSFLLDNAFHRRDKSIALARKCFNKTRRGGVVEQHPTDLANAEVDTSLSINVNVVTPDTLPDFVTGDNFGSAPNQQSQNLAGLILEFQPDAAARKCLTI
jgi:hypothetical protein